MKNTGNLKLTTTGDRTIEMTRVFDAPRDLVFQALFQPELVKLWLYGPEGWSMEVCEIDLQVGGRYRYVWHHENGNRMGMSGTYREIDRPGRVVATEAFDESWYPGEAVNTLLLTEENGRTTLVNQVEYQSAEALAAVLATPMEDGMALGYDRLAEVLAGMLASA